MQIKETTQPVQRTFTMEVTEDELRTIRRWGYGSDTGFHLYHDISVYMEQNDIYYAAP